jgi:hypothetical protein
MAKAHYVAHFTDGKSVIGRSIAELLKEARHRQSEIQTEWYIRRSAYTGQQWEHVIIAQSRHCPQMKRDGRLLLQIRDVMDDPTMHRL